MTDPIWVQNSDDPRVKTIVGVLTGKSGLDSADVWSLTRRIIEALDADAPYEYGIAAYGDVEDVNYIHPIRENVESYLQPEYGDVVVRRRSTYDNSWEPVP